MWKWNRKKKNPSSKYDFNVHMWECVLLQSCITETNGVILQNRWECRWILIGTEQNRKLKWLEVTYVSNISDSSHITGKCFKMSDCCLHRRARNCQWNTRIRRANDFFALLKKKTHFFCVQITFLLQIASTLNSFRFVLCVWFIVSSSLSSCTISVLLNHFTHCKLAVTVVFLLLQRYFHYIYQSICFGWLFTETYQSRVRRASLDYESSSDELAASVDLDYAQKKIIDEYGAKACVIEEPCKVHALRPGRAGAQPDWIDILR